MTIASLTAPTTAPAPAPKGAASTVQTATVPPDSQTAAVNTDAPVLSNLEMAVAAARQSAAARQDGLAVLMANLLRAAAAGNLPAPVQQAVDQLLALHLPTNVAPDAATVKTALLASGLFTEANLASNRIPADIKTTLLQLNMAAENWLVRASTPSLPAATPTVVRPDQAVPIAVPAAREPARRSRTNEAPGAKPATLTASAPPRSAPEKNQQPIEPDAAREAETVKSAIRLLGQITQAVKTSGVPELPKEIEAALVLVRNAIAPSTAPSPMAAPEAPGLKTATPPATPTAPATPVQPSPEPRVPASAVPIAKPAPVAQTSMPQALPAPIPGFSARGSSPVELLLALQLAPAPAPVSDVLPTPLAATVSALPSLDGDSVEALPTPSADVARAPTAPPAGQPNATPAKADGITTVPSPAVPSLTLPPSDVPSPAASPSFTPAAAPGLPSDAKTLLTLFAGAVEALLPRAPAMRATPQQPDAPLQQPQQPNTVPQQPPTADLAAAISTLSNAGLLTPASGGVPNDLKTLLLLFNMAAETWLPQAAPATAGTPSVPPPVRGVPSKAQPAALATLPENADPAATAKQLLSGSDAALARHTLLQIASLPDTAPQSRDARWVFDVPLMTSQGAAVAQMIIERDASGTSAEKPMPVWRVQFAIDIEPLGPVRANLALSGERAWVTISAERPESLDKLQSGVSWLADALQSSALEADIAFQPGLPQQRSGNASRFMDHAS